ncbi:hypothetical protein THTE_2945 [Thermogutta terrifontis]|uniref:Uncharacterized protein n=1 Tax=Thermogutta terrifontis TaxID=1331910 RepID=A0A286RHW6_9BACT|nr:hypothetical protein THTE_2945 [Thermogutta terrifontis]
MHTAWPPFDVRRNVSKGYAMLHPVAWMALRIGDVPDDGIPPQTWFLIESGHR